jgi:hypothetical protein
MRAYLFFTLLVLSIRTFSQVDTTEVFDISQFGDAEGVKRYCTQKVLNQTPTRIISLGYEYQGSFLMPGVPVSPMLPAMQDFNVKSLSSLRAQVNIPVVSTNSVIWQLGFNYWGSAYAFDAPGNNQFVKQLNERFMTSTGLNSTLFKPLNEKNFLIVQASADANGIFEKIGDVSSKSMTYSATAIYGWKKGEKNMIGTGIARTYRAGQLIHVPVLFWNKTFNDRWGMELLLPARGFLRYNFSTSSMLQAGFELEGNQFWMRLPNSANGAVYVQRGEFKPRIMWDKKISGFFWFNVQAGLRYNWRYDVMNEYDAKKQNLRYFSSNIGNPLYFNFSINFVSP